MKIVFSLLLALFCINNLHAAPAHKKPAAPHTVTQALPHEVLSALKREGIPLEAVGVEVRELNASPLISVNASQAMNPASTMKLLTTFAGLDLLGATYRWKTEAYIDGTLDKGVLHGNLIFKGYGDPKLTIEQFWLWLSEIRARGVKEIQGDLILDRSFFNLPAHDPGDFDGDPARAYNVGPDALLLNFNTLRLRYLPDGNRLKVISEPSLDGVQLDNQLTPPATPLNCDDWDDKIRIQARGDSVILQGGYPSECGEHEQNLNLMPHTRYVAAVFSAVWQELGGTLKGTAHDGTLSSSAKLLATHYSPTLPEVIRDINKFSNNVMARQLFLTLGTAAAANSTASLPLSISSVKNWLTQQHVDFKELVLENGAGLSRQERISAEHMAQLLQLMANHPLSAEMRASLPILGVDGSLKKRLKTSAAAGYGHLKTGTLDGVKTIAGFVKSSSGKEWIVVFFINHPNAKRGAAAQDALLEWVQKR